MMQSMRLWMLLYSKLLGCHFLHTHMSFHKIITFGFKLCSIWFFLIRIDCNQNNERKINDKKRWTPNAAPKIWNAQTKFYESQNMLCVYVYNIYTYACIFLLIVLSLQGRFNILVKILFLHSPTVGLHPLIALAL